MRIAFCRSVHGSNMAANPAANNSESSISARTRAVNLLRIVTNLLSDGNTAQDEAPAESSAVVASVPPGETHHNGSCRHAKCSQCTRWNEGGCRNAKFPQSFSGYRSAPSMHARPPPSKRVKRWFFVPKDTWTLDFFCLADTRCDTVPSQRFSGHEPSHAVWILRQIPERCVRSGAGYGLRQASSEEPGHVTIGGKRKVPNSNLAIYQGANVDLRRFQTALDNNLLHSQ